MTKDNKNSIWLVLQFSTSLILSLLGLKLNLLTFGSTVFSVWLLLASIWGVGSVLDLGFGISIIKFVAQNKDNSLKVSKILSTSLFLFLILGLVIFIFAGIVGELAYLHNPKLIPVNLESTSRLIFYLLGFIFYIQYITIVFKSNFEGHSDFVISSKIAIFASSLNFFCILLCFVLHQKLFFLVCLQAGVSIVQLSLFITLFLRKYSYLKIKPFSPDFSVFKEIITFSFSIQLANFIGSLVDPIIKYILGMFYSRDIIPTYEIARRFSVAISGLYGFAFRNQFPKTSVLSSKDEYTNYLYTNGVSVTRFGILFSVICFGVVSFVFALVFKEFYKSDGSLVLFLMLAAVESVNNAGLILYIFIIGIGKAVFLMALQMINVLIISASLLFSCVVFQNNFGLVGFFISVMFGNIAMLVFVKKYTGVEIKKFYGNIKIQNLFIFLVVIAINIVCLITLNFNVIQMQFIFSILYLLLISGEIINFLTTRQSQIVNGLRAVLLYVKK